MEDAGSSKRGYEPLFPTYTTPCRSRQHTHIHTHIDLCLWGSISHAQHHHHIIRRVYYTSAPTASWPRAPHGSGISFDSGISFALERGLPGGQTLQSPSTRHADRQGGTVACPRAKGVSQARDLLPSAGPQCGGRHFFSPTALCGPGEAASRGAPSLSP